MAGWKDFREIAAWQYARALKLRVDEFLERPNVRRRQKLHDQLYDAARSGPRNIAEGFAINAAVGLIRHLENTPDPPRAPRREKDDNPEPLEPE